MMMRQSGHLDPCTGITTAIFHIVGNFPARLLVNDIKWTYNIINDGFNSLYEIPSGLAFESEQLVNALAVNISEQ